ncbi:MAG: rod shape-determining protein RodA [Actinomycetota bacterium]|nr:rod shape-determining protein RodA [Actinomycetota bacterium]
MRAEGLFGQAVDRIGGEPVSARMARKAPIRHLDPSLLLITAMLAAFGAMMIFSATASKQEAAGLDPGTFMKRQVIYALAGTIALIVISSFDYRRLKGLAIFVYGITLAGLVLVLTPLSTPVGGATRWIDLGSFQMQPSELAKIGTILVAAAYLSERKEDITARDIAIVLGIVALPSALVFLEPDLGTMMVFVAITGALLLVAGAKLRHFLVLGVMGLVGIIVALQLNLIHDYQLERITAFLDTNPDPLSEGYNLTQAKLAIASGGLRGTGLDRGANLTTLDYVPEQHTDFIFTAIGEQLGFIGSATMLGLFALLIWRALRISAMAKDTYGTLIAAGIAALWGFQLFVNVGMTMGIMPITGIPLPFISYGGSSMMTHFIAVGLLHSIHMRRFL